MGEVYRARDERLERDVAIKVLPSGTLADEAARRRLRQEARALARLNHPHIATIHDLDAQDGVDFLVMEYVPGSTLAEKLAAGPLSEKDTLRLGAQVAAALEEAHAQRIVHRDLKPGNIVLTSRGDVKVLDFGVAKLLEPAEGETVTAETFTETRGVAGTLPYMAPEQLRGEPVDARTDIHALGAVLYEMSTGRRPFSETQGPRLIDAILNSAPAAPGRLQPRLSAELERIILKCLEKDPERRYQSARELRVDLERLAAPSPVTAPRVHLGASLRWAVPIAVALALLLAVRLGSDLGGLRDRLLGRTGAPRIQSLAVLPLDNLSGDPQQEYFVDGMHEELIARLAKISSLKVISRTSVMRYKGARKPPLPEIGRELDVDALIEGSVRRSGDQVRITVQLVEAATDRHLWAESYQGKVRDVLALQSNVAQAIANEIHITLTAQEQARLARASPVKPEAYEAYLRAKFAFRAHDRTGTQVEEAIRWLERATASDPNFAQAHAFLGRAYVSRFFSFDPNPEWERKAFAHIERAFALDPDLPEAYLARGDLTWTLANRFPHERAIQDYRKALELNPNLVDAHFALGSVYQHIGRFEETRTAYRMALQLDPHNPDVRYRIPRLHLYMQNYQAALTEFERNPDFPPAWQWQKALALNYLGRKEEALHLIEEIEQQLPAQEDVASTHALILASAGARAQAEEQIRIAVQAGEGKSHFHHAAYNIASAYALMGERRLALQWLKRTTEEGMPCYPLFEKDPNLDSLRADPEFVAFMADLKPRWGRLAAF